MVNSKIFTKCFLAFALSASVGNSDAASPKDARPEAEYKEERISGTDHWITHHNFSQTRLDALRVSIAKMKFPQPGGTVDKLLPVHVSLEAGGGIADMFPNEKGLLAIYDHYYSLSFDYVLHLRQGHYGKKGPKEGEFYFLDETAEIIPRSKIPKH